MSYGIKGDPMTRSLVSVFAMGAIFCGAVAVRAASPDQNKDAWKNDPAHEARRLVAEAADRTLKDKALDKTLDLVNKKDRDRIDKEIDKKEEANFQKAADAAQKVWKDKYGKEFDAE